MVSCSSEVSSDDVSIHEKQEAINTKKGSVTMT